MPGHSEIPGNELSHRAAKEVTTNTTNTILHVSFYSSLQAINDKVCNNPPSHEGVVQIYQHRKDSCDSK